MKTTPENLETNAYLNKDNPLERSLHHSHLRSSSAEGADASVVGNSEEAGPILEKPKRPKPQAIRGEDREEYRRRILANRGEATFVPQSNAFLAAPFVSGQANWVPLGPSSVDNTMMYSNQPISGRVRGIAISADGQRVYAAAANGGVWRSDDGGTSWYSTMESFFKAPTANHSDSLSSGAIAIDPVNPDRIYWGSGEGNDTSLVFGGLGPVTSFDGGINWIRENWKQREGAEDSVVYQIAVNPADPEFAIIATNTGLYRRQLRNQDDLASLPVSERLPEAYFLRYQSNNGQYSVRYWQPDGVSTEPTVSVPGSVGFQDKSFLFINNFGVPWFMRYDLTAGGKPCQFFQVTGAGALETVGAQQNLTNGNLFTTFCSAGLSYLLQYDSGTRAIWLKTIAKDGTLADVAGGDQKKFGSVTYTSILSVRVGGLPCVLCARGDPGFLRLYRWIDPSTYALQELSELSLGNFSEAHIIYSNSLPYVLLHDASSGNARIVSIGGSGAMAEVWRKDGFFPASATLSVSPYKFPVKHGSVLDYTERLLAYDSNTGDVSAYSLEIPASPQLLWSSRWSANKSIYPFGIGFEWGQVGDWIDRDPVTSVVAALMGDTPSFYAAIQNKGVLRSTDNGSTWTQMGYFPIEQGRVSLAVQEANPNVVYAQSSIGKIFRNDGNPESFWHDIGGVPANYLGHQGSYDLAIAVDPEDVNRIIIGGSGFMGVKKYLASLYVCDVRMSASGGYTIVSNFIGQNVHADIHTIMYSPEPGRPIWIGCDGGVFSSDNPLDANRYQSRNVGLNTMTVNRIGQFPANDAILFTGNQDNGMQRYTGDGVFNWGNLGDAGHVIVNSASPNQVLANYNQAGMYLSTSYGDAGTLQQTAFNAFNAVQMGQQVTLFYPPVANARALPGTVALGTTGVYISRDFGVTVNWLILPLSPVALANQRNYSWRISALAFREDGTRLYVGRYNGTVEYYNDAGGAWTATPVTINDSTASPPGIPLNAPITSIVLDPNSPDDLFVSLGGNLSGNVAGWQRVWKYTSGSSTWAAASGPGAGNVAALMNIQYNALLIWRDTVAGQNYLYAGGDLGIWRSLDGGVNWAPYADNLPEAAVLDLQYFPAGSVAGQPALLRAATYGRGSYEKVLSADPQYTGAVQLFLRQTQLARGLYNVPDSTPDPIKPTSTLYKQDGWGIRQLPSSSPLFNAAELNYGSFFTEMKNEPYFKIKATDPVKICSLTYNRGYQTKTGLSVYFLVSQRLKTLADLAAYMPNPTMPELIAEAQTALTGVAELPGGYQASVRNGVNVAGNGWRTFGIMHGDDVSMDVPNMQSALFKPENLASNLADRLGLWAVVTLVTSPDDPYPDSAPVNVYDLVAQQRKAAMKFIIVTT